MKFLQWFKIPCAETAFRHITFVFLFSLFFLLAYGGASVISGFVPYQLSVDFSFEQYIPYSPYASPVYLTLNIMLLMAPFLLRCWKQMWLFFSVLIAETVIAVLVFIVVPVEATPTVQHTEGFLAAFYALAEVVNFERNEFPSLHVAYAVTAALVYQQAHGKVAGRVFGIWSAAIVVSTVLMKEHYVLDVIAGVALACFVWFYLRHRFSTESMLSRVDVELIALREMLTFSRRHRRYATIMISIYAASLFGWRKRRILRTGFASLQWIDDLLDHDRVASRPPLQTAQSVVVQLNGGPVTNTRLSRLIAAMDEDINSESRALVIEIIELMCEDNRRMTHNSLLSAGQLKRQLDQTFVLSMDLVMHGTKSPLRADEFPDLIQALSWCSMERDLADDLKRGLINIPSEVINGASFHCPLELLQLSQVQQWRESQRLEIIPILDRLDATLKDDNRKGVGLLRMFSRSIRKYTRR